MIILIVTLKDKLIANIVAWTHSCFWGGAILLLQFWIDFLVYYVHLYFMLHILSIYLIINSFNLSSRITLDCALPARMIWAL